MPDFPSKILFAAYLQYAPQGHLAESRNSKDVVLAIKNDGFHRSHQIIPYAIERFAQDVSKLGEYRDWFSIETTLIPAPKSAPIVAGSVWPGHRICEELRKQNLGGDIFACLRRKVAIRKSARSPGNRPDPIEHYQSVEVITPKGLLFAPERILLVDDVVTRGSTFIGLTPRIRERFPEAEILCFALIRTKSNEEIEKMPAPIVGQITFDGVYPQRTP